MRPLSVHWVRIIHPEAKYHRLCISVDLTFVSIIAIGPTAWNPLIWAPDTWSQRARIDAILKEDVTQFVPCNCMYTLRFTSPCPVNAPDLTWKECPFWGSPELPLYVKTRAPTVDPWREDGQCFPGVFHSTTCPNGPSETWTSCKSSDLILDPHSNVGWPNVGTTDVGPTCIAVWGKRGHGVSNGHLFRISRYRQMIYYIGK